MGVRENEKKGESITNLLAIVAAKRKAREA